VRLCRAADLDDFLDMSIENFTGDIISLLYAQIIDIYQGCALTVIVICYIYLSTTKRERNMKGQILLTILYIIIVKCNIIVSEIRG
jgi:hypothetical protein